MGKRIVGYAISHAGYDSKGRPIKGGPYEAQRGVAGTPTKSLETAHRSLLNSECLVLVLFHVRSVYPNARIVRIIRRTKVRVIL